MPRKKPAPNLQVNANAIGFAMILFIFCSQTIRFFGEWVLGSAFQVADGFADAPPWAFGIYSLLVPLVSFLPAIIFLQKHGKRYGIRIGLTLGKIPVWLLVPIFLGVVMVVNAVTAMFRALLLQGLGLPLENAQKFPQSVTGKVFYFIAICIMAPILEELLFRGGIQGLLRPFGRWFAMFLTSVLFSILHLNLVELPGIFALSFILCYVAEITGSVFPCIVLHFSNNVYSFLSLWARNRLEGMAALAFSFWVVLIIVVFFAGALWIVRTQKLGKSFFLSKQTVTLQAKQKVGLLAHSPVFIAGIVSSLLYFLLRLLILK